MTAFERRLASPFPGAEWKKVEQLINEQKLEEADQLVKQQLEKAQTARNSSEWTYALVLDTRLRTALHGYETSIKNLLARAWPQDVLSQAILNLNVAQSLTQYANAYDHEIKQRERTAGERPSTDLEIKSWTLKEIYDRAERSHLAVWKNRAALRSFSSRELDQYFSKGNYPATVRPSLHDTASYLYVSHLADSRGWTPQEANEIHTQDLTELLEKTPRDVLAVQGRHPMVRLAAVLGELEAFHGSRNPEAALEARLELLRNLHTHFTLAADRERIRAYLELKLKGFRQTFPKHEWWSAGMAQLAVFTERADSADALIRARAIAEEGHALFPASHGGQHCLSIQKNIEAPSYDVQAMGIDGLGRRSVEVSYKNIERLYFRAFSFDFLQAAKAEHFNPGEPVKDRLDEALRSGGVAADFEWSVELPKTADYRRSRVSVEHQIKKNGFYRVAVSARPDFAPEQNFLTGFYFSVSPFVLTHRNFPGAIEYSVLDGSTGQPVEGAKATLFRHSWQKPPEIFAHGETDREGLVHFDQTFLRKLLRLGDSYSYFLVAEKDGARVVETNSEFYGGTRSQKEREVLIYTDRSTYRPLQKVQWKILALNRSGQEEFRGGEPNTVVTGSKIRVDLLDPNHQIVHSETVVTNRFGTASGIFVIPSGKRLGRWTVRTPHGSSAIGVEEYKRPTFEAKLLDPVTAIRLNEPAVLKGEAKYHFGLPLPRGAVQWQVTREPMYSEKHGDHDQPSRKQIVATGSSELAADGTFSVQFTPEAPQRPKMNGRSEKDQSTTTYRYVLVAQVTDEGGETRTAERVFRVGFSSVEARVKPESSFFTEKSRPGFTVLRTNLDGVPAAGNATWRVKTLVMPAETILPADFAGTDGKPRPRFNPDYSMEEYLRSWSEGATLHSGALNHDGKGEARLEVEPLAPGAYRLSYETVDGFGKPYVVHREFIVASKHMSSLPLPALLLPEKEYVKVGETARILLGSGFKDQVVDLEIFRAGKRTEKRRFRFLKDSGPVGIVEIPVTEKLRGGFGVTLSTVRDYQHLKARASVFVPWENKELKVSFTSFRDLLRPGAKETFKIQVSGPEKAKSEQRGAEILAYMFDKSLDLFGAHLPPSVISLFPNLSASHANESNLRLARSIWLQSRGFPHHYNPLPLTSDTLLEIDRYGIGGPGRRFYESSMTLGKSIPNSRSADVMSEGATIKALEKNKAEAQSTEVSSGDRQEGPALRSNFAETGFWYPHLMTDKNGSVAVEFSVPDSITGWHVWVHALTADLKSGSLQKDTATFKDLMVRPYLPRFLREGDEAEIRVVVNNAGKAHLAGKVVLEMIDPVTEKSVLKSFVIGAPGLPGESRVTGGQGETSRSFSIPPALSGNGSATVAFPIRVPAQVGSVAFKITAEADIGKAERVSDGELRLLPILPGRMHLAQSRFAVLKDRMRKEMRFNDLEKSKDPSLLNEQLVLTLDAQLFYSVLASVPYLVNYPYECTEQLMNRFLSTGILTSLYQKFPAVERMARKLSGRKTRVETFVSEDPNRKMSLEETPWLEMAKGGGMSPDLINVLDSAVARATRENALNKLKKAQNADGGFPWFPGGKSSPYMTLYLAYGFSKGLEFGVEAPRESITRAWEYLHQHYVTEVAKLLREHDTGWEFVTFLNYTLSNYPDPSWAPMFTADERKAMLDFSFRHWKEHTPFLKGYLALTLKRSNRLDDGKLVWASVMDSSRSSDEEGTHWAAEDRSWLWYNDTIETHAFALRTLMELEPKNPKLEGLVLWLFLNKKMNHWKSTRATAEVLYSLTHYLKAAGQLGVNEEAKVTFGGKEKIFTFPADEYTGHKNQLVSKPEPAESQSAFGARHSPVIVEKQTPGLLFASATWHFSTERLPTEGHGDVLSVSRKFFRRFNQGKEFVLEPLARPLRIGEEVEVQLSIRSRHAMEYVHLRDPRAAGFEPVSQVSRHHWANGLTWYEEIRDNGANFFFERLPAGEVTLKYRLRASGSGKYRVSPATIQGVYAPEFTGYSAGAEVRIEP
ncbi:MAG: hypothetical protein A2603_03595 [Bdellovibrionales bacterium RIFOXYD1_FULL_55_31]|nr:MAG: hypothetical protein A2603_03595 [Bdellovibrionales bacterium RIFOXYD1_FULL_55_31]